MPKFLIVKPVIDIENISTKDQWEYWLIVGMSLYLVKHSHPDLANTTRELSKAKDGMNPAAQGTPTCNEVCVGHEEHWSKNKTHRELQ